MSESHLSYGNEKDFTPPVTRAQAYSMIEPLNPGKISSPEKRRQAYARLLQFIDLIIPE